MSATNKAQIAGNDESSDAYARAREGKHKNAAENDRSIEDFAKSKLQRRKATGRGRG